MVEGWRPSNSVAGSVGQHHRRPLGAPQPQTRKPPRVDANPGGLGLAAGSRRAQDGAGLKVLEVAWIEGRGEDLDDAEKVAQGADGWHGLVRAEGPARDGEQESLFDNSSYLYGPVRIQTANLLLR